MNAKLTSKAMQDIFEFCKSNKKNIHDSTLKEILRKVYDLDYTDNIYGFSSQWRKGDEFFIAVQATKDWVDEIFEKNKDVFKKQTTGRFPIYTINIHNFIYKVCYVEEFEL